MAKLGDVDIQRCVCRAVKTTGTGEVRICTADELTSACMTTEHSVVSTFVVMLVTNNGYMPFVRNFLTRLRQLDVKWVPLVACLDDECFTALASNTTCVPFRLMDGDAACTTSTELERWGSKNYKNVMTRKIDAWMSLLRLSDRLDIMYMDTDIWLFEDPLPATLRVVSAHPEADMLGQCDSPQSTRRRHTCFMCAGYFFMRNTSPVLNLFDWRTRYSRDYFEKSGLCDQLHIHEHRHELRIVHLSHELFPNGKFIHGKCVSPRAVILHYNYIRGAEKIVAMRLGGHWIEDATAHSDA